MYKLPFAKKALGQYWLTDPEALQAMCDAAEIMSVDAVLEVGPGLGTLTQLLAAQAGRVIAVELDTALAAELPGRVTAGNLEVVTEDILKFDLTTLPPGYRVVANIPYYLTSNLVRVLSESTNPPAVAVLLVQKEVAERVAAKPGDMSILAVTAQYSWTVRLGRVVPAALFVPKPKVDSQILVLTHRPQPLFPDIDTKLFFRIVKAGFSQKRKTLLNSLAGGLHLSKVVSEQLLRAAQVEPNTRAQSLSLENWYHLYTAFQSITTQ